MRIAVWHNLPSGGGKRALNYHVRGLAAQGHHVEVWCPDTADQDYLPLRELAEEHVLPFRWREGTCPLPVLRSMPEYVTVRGRLRAMHEHCEECAEQMVSRGFDLLFAGSCKFFGAPAIACHAGLPSVLYLQEPFRRLYEALPEFPWAALRRRASFRARIRDLVKIRAMRIHAREEIAHAGAFGRILVNSRFSREGILRTYGLESKVCYLGVDTDLFRPSGRPRERFVVALGGLYAGKGADRAVRAIGAIPGDKRPGLVWIGNFSEPSYQREIETLATGCGVEMSLKIGLPDSDVVECLSRASVMIYTPRLEPFGFAPLEANACGTPVVAIAEGGVRETIEDGVNGYLVDDDDPQALGEALLRLLDDPESSRQMGERARRHVESRWSLEKAVDRLEEHLQATATGSAESND